MRTTLLTMTAVGLTLPALTLPAAQAVEGKSPADAGAVVVAVMDTGIAAHSDLGWRVRPNGTGRPGGSVLPGYDFISDPWAAMDGDGWDPDPTDRGDGVKPDEAEERPGCKSRVSSWHGTNVAGTVAAQGASEILSLGIAPQSRIVPIRIMGRCGGNTADVAAGLLWAVGAPVPGVPDNPNPATIVNVSLSGGAERCPLPLQTAIDVANERGAVVVVAAGSAARGTSVSTPANCDGVVVVGSTDKYGKRSPTSNFGPEVTVSALGGDMSTGERDGIYTTTNKGSYRPRKPGYGYYQSSSAAAARVTGALALLAARSPGAAPQDLVAQLMTHLDPFVPGQCDQGDGNCGQGILNLERLVTGR